MFLFSDIFLKGFVLRVWICPKDLREREKRRSMGRGVMPRILHIVSYQRSGINRRGGSERGGGKGDEGDI